MNKRIQKFLAVFSAAALLLRGGGVFAEETAVSTDLSTQSSQNDSVMQGDGFVRLLTSNNPDFYAVIETDGDVIRVRGNAALAPITQIFITNDALSTGLTQSFKGTYEGEFSSEMTFKPVENGYYKLYFKLSTNRAMWFQLKYNDGWCIPDNGLAVDNASKLQHITEADPMAAAYYISDSADKEEISQTLDKLKEIADGVCQGETDDYKKAYLLYCWVAENVYYDHEAAETSVTLETVAIHNVLDTLKTTCAGFANTYCALLEAEGIRSVNLKGAAVAGEITYDTLNTGRENHEFTAFWYEEQSRWVYADPCWGGAGNYIDGKFKPNILDNKYFDITSEAFALDHRVDRAEERHYFKALEAVNAGGTGSEPEVLDPHHYSETSDEGSGDDTDFPDEDFTDNNAENTAANSPQKPIESGNVAPYIILGLTGVLIIGVGIILAVNKRKK